jgi:hypothetical protein
LQTFCPGWLQITVLLISASGAPSSILKYFIISKKEKKRNSSVITPMFLSYSQPIYSLSLWIDFLWTFHLNGITQYVVLTVWFLSLSITFSWFNCIVSMD